MNKVQIRSFQYAQGAADWINKENIDVVSICDAGRYSEGVMVFYRETVKATPLALVRKEIIAMEKNPGSNHLGVRRLFSDIRNEIAEFQAESELEWALIRKHFEFLQAEIDSVGYTGDTN